MKLFEFQARDLLARYGVAVPKGLVACNEEEAVRTAQTLGADVVVKAQVLSGGRSKAGGVKRVKRTESVQKAAHEILSMSVDGLKVSRILVAEALTIAHEYYIGLTIDRTDRCVRCMMSEAGGIDIEEVSRATPEKIITLQLPPYSSEKPFDAPEALNTVFGDEATARKAATIVSSLVRLFYENDCSLVEINPLILTKENALIAADAKIVIDDNALFKHPDLALLRNPEEHSADERAAQRAGLSFVGLDGSIGCMVNGAGLAMATMDLIQLFGAKPANFLDVGGSSNPQKVIDAFTILVSNPGIKVILVNIFGGITRCDDVARGIILAKEQLKFSIPLVVRLIGTNEREARDLLAEAGITEEPDMISAVRAAVALKEASL